MYSSTRSRRRRGLRRSILWLLTLPLMLVGLLGGRVFISRALSPWSLGNYANTAVQLGANTTITPDAAPAGAVSINVSTSTNFKGKLEGNPATGVVRITDAHPAGSYTVTVTAFDGGPTTKTFTLTVTTPVTCTAISFAAATNFNTASDPASVAVGDFNGDGKQDMAVANNGADNVSVLSGNGAGGFSAPGNFTVGSQPLSVAVGDFNGDGKQDLAVANAGSTSLSVLLGDGAGSFGAAANVAVGVIQVSVAVGDFNGDGRQDLVTANQNTSNVSVLLGNGAGGFSGATNFGVGSQPQSVAIGDFNGDGKQDLAVANSSSNTISVLLGNGAGSFSAATNFGADTAPGAVVVGDFNGDSKQDLAVANEQSNNVSILLGNGAGGFSAPTNFGVGVSSLPFSLAVGDFDGNGRQDLAVAKILSNNVAVLSGNGAGGFSAPTNFAVGTQPIAIAVGDFDGDGREDLATANQTNVSVLLRQCPPSALGNYPNQSVQVGGNTTVLPDAVPTNAPRINVSASTNFLGQLEANKSTGVVRVTNAHPAGSYTVTVEAFDGGPSARTFTLTVTTPVTCNPISLSAPTSLGAGSQPKAAAVGDFNGDGKQDLAVANRNSNNVSILLGNGDGTFAASSNYLADSAPNAVVVADFDGDGIQDLAVANNSSDNVSVLLGGGGGVFGLPANFAVSSGPFALAAGDFNGDGKPDLVTANNSAANVSVLLGDGLGSFSAAINFNVGSFPESVAVGDFNGDGKQDLAAANAASNNVSILLGNGAGGFAAATNFNVGSLPFSVVVGDFNADGKQDLATANRNSDNVSVLLGNGAGSFSAATNYAAGQGAISLALGDFNGDGKQDIITANLNSADASVLVGDGAGNFAAPMNFSLGAFNSPSSIAVGDFNGDGKQDVVSANNATNDVSVLLRQCAATVTLSGRVKKDSGNGLINALVTLSGSASDSTLTDNNGDYSFSNVAAGGNYTVTPTFEVYAFSPVNQTFNNLNVNHIANFVGTRTLVTISGQVTDAGANPINNVSVKLTQNGAAAGTAQTNAGGNYSFGNLITGANYVVMPVGRFAPTALTFSNLTTDGVASFKAAPAIPLQCSTVSFAAATNFGVGTNPKGITIGDFNGDGKLDVVDANQNPTNGISLLLGTGAGGFTGPTNFDAGNGPVSVAVGDFNADGKLDLVAAKFAASNVSLLLGNGAGSFAAATNFAAGSNPDSVAVGDFNGDGQLDLALANAGSSNVSVLLGNGAGGFAAATNFAVGPNPVSVTVGDFNGDGKLDMAVANQGSNNVSVLLGNGSGGFAAATNFAAGSAPTSLAVGDLNSDGKYDLAVANDGSDNVSVLFGDGLGGFGAATNFAVPPASNPGSVVLGDFNGDGKLDMATENNNSGKVSVLLGDGNGSFNAATSFDVGTVPTSLAVGDFNGDGKSDLAVTNQNNNNVSLLLNNGSTCGTQTSLDISGQVTDALATPLPDVTVTLSGTITRVVQTDTSGKYSFASLTPGGNYSVTLQSSYFMFAASRADFFNLSSNQSPIFAAVPVAVPTATPPLSDDFNSPTRDPNKWNLGTLTLPPSALDPRVTTAQVNGQLVITPLAQTSGQHYHGYVSANSFDLRNGKASVELVKAASGGADTIFSVGSDSDNFYRFLVHTPGAATSLTQAHPGNLKNDRAVPFDATGALLIFQVRINGQLTSLSINYDPVLHRFMRFRHEPPTNSIVFETSPNDIDYTVQSRVTLQKSVSALTAELTAGTSNPANPGAAIFDNFGLVTSTFQFSAGAYTVAESAGLVTVTVTRSGTTTNAASVDFATADGTAQQRTRYINTAGRLSFAAGELSKTFDVLIEDDAQAQGNETVNLLLLNPVGSGLNSPGRALLNITDNDSVVATGNPLDDPRFFVQQNYFDFLSRFPDQGGSDFWISVITGPPACAAGDLPCVSVRRITVSNAFFFEQEFQQTGAYVFRVYRAAFGNNQPFSNPDANPQFPGQNLKLPSYEVFARDRAQVVGGSSLSQSQLDLANAFVQRPEFLAKYPASLDGPGFVDAILATIMNDLGVNLSSQRNALIALFNQGGQGGRGNVLYRLADDNESTNPINNRPLIDAEYIRSFVATQYFGYLRRDADIGGFLFWLGQVNSAPLRNLSKQRAMVCSFITSGEYQQRFSSIITHTNQECQ